MKTKEERLKLLQEKNKKLAEEKIKVNDFEPSYQILSFGGGVQTQAMLLKLTPLFRNNPKAWVIFADTGNEHQETYDYITKYSYPYCKKHNINFVRVHSKYNKTLYDYCFDKKIVPSMKFRDCTTKFKIAPIRRFLRNELKVTRKSPCNIFIGISWDEATRMNPSTVKYAHNVYPFIDGYRDLFELKDGYARITRDDCKKLSLEGFGEVPPKSGCWHCPFSRTADFLKTKKENPKLFEKIVMLEENNSRYPEIKLRGMGKNTKSIRDLMDSDESRDSCKSGYCMV